MERRPRGGMTGLEALYREHRQGLYTLALSVTGDGQSAEDAVHEVFARLCRSAGSGKEAVKNPVAFAYRAVRNAAIDHRRRVARQATPTEDLSLFNGRAAAVDEAVADAEAHRRLQAAVDQLPEAQKEAVIMRAFAGLSFEQMAEATGEPLGTVNSRYRRALSRLREMLEDERDAG